jgi:tRNA (cytidine/uridine-2'-O-)-methyltransferase
MRVALYQPDIPQNTGTILRLCACLGIAADIVEPAGFDLSGRALKRAALDYAHSLQITRYETFAAFKAGQEARGSRLVLLTTKAASAYHEFAFRPSDTIMAGRESAGVPEDVHMAADSRVRIPMCRGLRSLNVAVALAMVLGEALRQTGGFSSLA